MPSCTFLSDGHRELLIQSSKFGSGLDVQKSPIRISDINLENFEVPPSIRFGGRHRLAVHTLSGGSRVVERLGPSDSDIYFRGTFSGPDAEARVRAMDDLRVTGRVVWLTWKSFRYQVIVRTFLADYQSPWWISYQVTCLVVHQTTAVPAQRYPQRALIAADLGYALAAITGTAIQLGLLVAALAAENMLTPGAAYHGCAVAAVELLKWLRTNRLRGSPMSLGPVSERELRQPNTNSSIANVVDFTITRRSRQRQSPCEAHHARPPTGG